MGQKPFKKFNLNLHILEISRSIFFNVVKMKDEIIKGFLKIFFCFFADQIVLGLHGKKYPILKLSFTSKID